jgi:ribA/ribD-fused uncharacterized protein
VGGTRSCISFIKFREGVISVIETFRGEYSFLSNFQYLEKPLHGYPTVEHFYQAMKTLDSDERDYIKNHPSKGLKTAASQMTLREDWEVIKLDVMLYGLRFKFSDNNPVLKSKLIATGDLHIQEGNWWNDKFWGVCLKTGVGENHLGKLLMQVRGEVNV